ncbi:MAG: NifB/NifX family molybdenum-iron cluster-binding protein [Candidatus Omnitrophica bacterium]|nr:NifB/NifX family molybdenum-iron cluster-binding protein [Candidatus Omnitrophota bacterium]
MRICIPTETEDGLKAKVNAHFGSATYFTIYDTENNTAEAIPNNNQYHIHGMCQPMGILSGKNIDVVICSGMGLRAIQKLNEGGIKAYKVIAGTVADIIKEYKGKRLEEITVDSACTQHDCH